MAGGVFPGKPFEFNVKCIVFSLILSLGYWFAPHRNLWVLAFLLWFPYLAMAWYDWSYKCESKLQPTAVPFGRYIWLPFKPPSYKKEFDELPPEKIQSMINLDHLILWSALAIATAYFLIRK